MKKTIILLLLLNTALLGFAQSYFTKQDVNVRSGAGSNYEILGVVPKGEKIEIMDISNGWGRISFQNNEGFVSMNYLEYDSNTSNAVKETEVENKKNKSSSPSWITFFVVITILFMLRNIQPFKLIFQIIGRLLKVSLTDDKNTSNSSKPKILCKKCGWEQTPSTLNPGNCNAGGKHDWTLR